MVTTHDHRSQTHNAIKKINRQFIPDDKVWYDSIKPIGSKLNSKKIISNDKHIYTVFIKYSTPVMRISILSNILCK